MGINAYLRWLADVPTETDVLKITWNWNNESAESLETELSRWNMEWDKTL